MGTKQYLYTPLLYPTPRLLPPAVPHRQPPRQLPPPLVQVINSAAAPTSAGVYYTYICAYNHAKLQTHAPIMLFQGAEEEVLRSFQNLSDPQDDQRYVPLYHCL